MAAAKRFKKVENATAVIWKTLLIAEKTFRRLDAPELLAEVANGMTYVIGVDAVNRKRAEGRRLISFTHFLTGPPTARPPRQFHSVPGLFEQPERSPSKSDAVVAKNRTLDGHLDRVLFGINEGILTSLPSRLRDAGKSGPPRASGPPA